MKSKKFRKWISCVTAVGVFAACGAGFANEAVQISEDLFGAVVSADFEENGVENYGFDYVSGGISVKKADDSHGNVLYAEATESTSTRAYGVKPGISRPMYLAMLINDNDIGTRRGWIEYGGGIAVDKDPS